MSGMRRFHLVALATAALVASGCGDDDGTGPDAGQPVCGNGIVEGTEACDDGNPTAKDGCEATCTFSCDGPEDCNDGDACNGIESCNTALHRCQAGTPLENGLACEYYVPGAPIGDSGVFGDPVLMSDGICVNQACGKPCIDSGQCDDLNACNGVETCDTVTYNVCVRGAAPNCNDGLDCTADSCDPVTGCANVLYDGDMDGYAAENVACDSRGGDCNDNDEFVYPTAPELCSDGKDNDCDGKVDAADTDMINTWYKDCDADGYAANSDGSVTQCEPPGNPSADACGGLAGGTWTAKAPLGVNIDCDDTYNQVHPGADWHYSPYCIGRSGAAPVYTGTAYSCNAADGGPGGTKSSDWNCDMSTELGWVYGTYYGYTCLNAWAWYLTTPECGETIELVYTYGTNGSCGLLNAGGYQQYCR